MQIAFHGAARVVTGSKHLIKTSSGKKILLDCGLFQGHINNKENLNRYFSFTPAEIDFLILSHAHIDHSGLIPKLVHDGFKGLIFATPATIDLCEIMLLDSAHIQQDDVTYINKRRSKHGETLLEPLYNSDDVLNALKLMVPVEYNELLSIDEELDLEFTDAGHLLGSAMVNLDIREGNKLTKITFTGDVGRAESQILRSPQAFRQCDVLICESTYGNRLHPPAEDVNQALIKIVWHTCIEKQGKLIIPAFSVDRTQDLLYILERASNEKRLPEIKIYVDSPLSVKATGIIKKHRECYNEAFIEYIKSDPEPFEFKNLHYITDADESKRLNESKEPCIIISASGMAEAGRIRHHIKNNVENPRNTILFPGYCTPESLGGHLKNGDKTVRIFRKDYTVKAQIESMDSFSAHGDYREILSFLECQDPKLIKKVFLVHGEYETQLDFKLKFEQKGYRDIFIPEMHEVFEVDGDQ